MNRQHKQASPWRVFALSLGAIAAMQLLPLGQRAQAEPEGQTPGSGVRTLAEQLVHDLREGKLALEGDHAAVSELILKRNIPIPAKYIESLIGPACVICHASNDPTKSYRGLDLSTCEGILRGSQEEPRRQLFTPGQDPKRDVLVRRLRNNRMPLGVHFNVPKDSPSHLAVRHIAALRQGRCLRPRPAGLHPVPHVQSGAPQLP